MVSPFPRGIFTPRRPGPHPHLAPRPSTERRVVSAAFWRGTSEEPRWGRGVAPRCCCSRAGKKMERGWTGEKGLPGKLRRRSTTRSAAAWILRHRRNPRRCRVDPSSPPRSPPPPRRSVAAASIPAASAWIRRRRIDLRCLCVDLPPQHRSPSPPRRSTSEERGGRGGASGKREAIGEAAPRGRERGSGRKEKGCAFIYVYDFLGYTANVICICK